MRHFRFNSLFITILSAITLAYPSVFAEGKNLPSFYNEVKGLWYVDTYHTHWAMPQCQCEAQLLGVYTDPEYPLLYTRFCIKKNNKPEIYHMPIKTNTQQGEFHWLLSLQSMNLGYIINQFKPNEIDLNFHMTWQSDTDTNKLKCHSQYSNHDRNNRVCKTANEKINQPITLLVGDNPSNKSDFIMLLKRNPLSNNNIREKAVKSANSIYQPERYKHIKFRTNNWNELSQCTIKLNEFIQTEVTNHNLIPDIVDNFMLMTQLERISEEIKTNQIKSETSP